MPGKSGRSRIYDWEMLRQIYFDNPKMSLNDLSREVTGFPDRPSIGAIRGVSAKQRWKEQRDQVIKFREEGGVSSSTNMPHLANNAQERVAVRTVQDLRRVELDRKFALDRLVDIEKELARPVFTIDEDQGYALEDLPEHLHDRYKSAVTDPHLMSLRRDIALVSSLIASCSRRMQTGEPSARSWKRLREQAIGVIGSKKQGDEQAATQKLSELLRMISKGCPEVELQDELLKLIDSRLKTIAAEANRLKTLQEFMDRESTLSIARQFAEAVKQHVHDPAELRAIATEFQRIRQGVTESRSPTTKKS